MAVDAGFVRKMFAGLEHGDGAGFFAHVADDVDWTVMGTHPLAGHYKSKTDFIAGTLETERRILGDIADIVEEVAKYKTRHVCVTGGEPLAQKRCLDLLALL